MNVATPFLLLALSAVAVAAGTRSLWLRGTLDGIAAWWRGASRAARAVALALLLVAVACGSDKTPGGGLRFLPRRVATQCVLSGVCLPKVTLGGWSW